MMDGGIDTSAGMPDVRLDQIRFKYIPRKHASLAEKCAGEMRRKTREMMWVLMPVRGELGAVRGG